MSEYKVREFKTMANIFKEGDRGDSAYILKKGRVLIYTTVHGDRLLLTELTAPTIFGEMALLAKDNVRSASAEANSDVQVIEITKAKFDEAVTQSPSLIALVLQNLAKRLVETNSRVRRTFK